MTSRPNTEANQNTQVANSRANERKESTLHCLGHGVALQLYTYAHLPD